VHSLLPRDMPTVLSARAEREFLIGLKDANPYLPWLEEEGEGKWEGVCVKGSRVVQLRLASRNCKGSISKDIESLCTLEYLSLEDNSFRGETS
jgi:hypothetical protein